ncbi:MAG: ABC transporter ATP-binding protein/permease [Lachnospiraceae bacterium]|nr:ABC transporter ATP-binding protein/permease [Lachnospiraceae bacterium]
MKYLLKYLKNYKLECVLGPLFKLLEASFELFIPLLVRRMIDIGVTDKDAGCIIKNGVMMVALGLIGLVCSLAAQYFSAKAAVFASAAIKRDVFRNIMSLSYSEIDNIGTSTMITRMTGDINTLQNGINMSLRLLLRSPFVVFGAVIMSFFIDLKAAGIFVLTVLLLAVVVYGVMFITAPMHKSVQGKLDNVTLSLRSSLNGVRVIRAFGLEKSMEKEFTDANGSLVQLQLKTGKISALMNPVTFVMINGAAVWLIWSGAVSVDAGTLTQGSVVALINYMSQILVELIKLANMIVLMSKSLACADRIATLLNTKSSMTEGTFDKEWSGNACRVDFEDCSLRYGNSNEKALEGISFSVMPGETVGVIGGTGSGKTTLINLISRFYDVCDGSVKVDGTDVRDYRYSALRKRIAVVPQKSVLISGSIRKNMTLGSAGISDDDIYDALKTAEAYEIVKGKDGALDYEVSHDGTDFSGGQRQRLCIARALLKKPGILILDDSTSALDYATDAALRKNLKEMKTSPTVFIVSQRTASIMHADKIIVLDEGRTVGQGTHEELLESCAVYREIYESQN